MSMTERLPAPLDEYFDATNAHDVTAMIAGFTADSVVADEGRQYHGLAAIRDWMQETIEKYDYQVAPIRSSQSALETVVLVSLRGAFPGSPIQIHYAFTIESQKIARLEIA
jgi:hypothetical protein